MKKNFRREDTTGFTLIELMTVISIIALLSSIILASLASAKSNARLAAARQFANSVTNAVGDRIAASWNFTECSGSTITDNSGNGNSASTNGAVWSTDVPLQIGCSLVFSGQYIPVGVNSMPAINEQKTISIWAKYSSLPTTADFFSMDNASGSGVQVGFRAGAMVVWQWGGGFIVTDPQTPTTNTWHNYVYTYDGTYNTLYVDGVQVGKTTVATQTGATTRAAIANWAGGGELFYGSLYNPQVFSGSITAAAVSKMYYAELPVVKRLAFK